MWAFGLKKSKIVVFIFSIVLSLIIISWIGIIRDVSRTEGFSIFVAHGLSQEIIKFISFLLLNIKEVVGL